MTARTLIGLSLGVTVALSTPIVFAKEKKPAASAKKNEKKRVLVGGFDGPKSDQARKAVIAALKDDGEYDVSDSEDAKPGASDKAYAKASGGAAAVLVGSVKKGKGLTLSVHNGADGALIQDVEIKGDSPAKLSKNIDSTLAVSVADAIAQTKASDAAASDEDEKPATKKDDEDEDEKPAAKKDEDEKKDEEPAAPTSSDDSPSLSALELEAGLRAEHRSFDYHDTPAMLFPGQPTKLPSYTLPLGPAFYIEGTIYPLAFGSKGAAANFGITGSYETLFATKSVYLEGTPQEIQYKTHSSQFFIGLRGRIPVAVHEFGLVAGYGQHAFSLVGGDPTQPNFPDVSYKFIRLSADARLRFDAVTLGVHVGTRLVSGVGSIKSDYWFANAKAQSFEAGASLGYSLSRQFDLIAGVDLLRYAFDFNPIPDNMDPALVAGGAVDEYISGSLGLRYTLRN
ncbi:MAG TPA: hypothetical protein VHV51_15540 [Polyangiaceae bacterium]|nr:hypothetical protein [Polyangiaceae bacterium]